MAVMPASNRDPNDDPSLAGYRDDLTFEEWLALPAAGPTSTWRLLLPWLVAGAAWLAVLWCGYVWQVADEPIRVAAGAAFFVVGRALEARDAGTPWRAVWDRTQLALLLGVLGVAVLARLFAPFVLAAYGPTAARYTGEALFAVFGVCLWAVRRYREVRVAPAEREVASSQLGRGRRPNEALQLTGAEGTDRAARRDRDQVVR